MQHSTRDKDPLISPLSGAESLFLGAALEATDISATTMLEQLEQNMIVGLVLGRLAMLKKNWGR